jgi:hypothetical protein
VEQPREEAIDERAAALQAETDDEDLQDPEVAHEAAEQLLQESRERQDQAEDLEPTDDEVIRRSSEETADEP